MSESESKIIVKSPGRVNIIGEHTDYNNGFVLPAAIDKGIVMRLRKNGSLTNCKASANNLQEEFSFDLKEVAPIQNGWQNYILGVVSELSKLGGNIRGFDCSFEGDVPIGSGMSSSAALECSLAFGLNELFDLGFDQWQLIKVAQKAEHHFVGTKCGIMDQFASIMGKKDQVMLLDCRSLGYQYFPFDLGNYQLLLVNTNVSHSLASSEYNTRRQECNEAVTLIRERYPDVASLRDVSLEMLSTFSESLPETIFKRCRHVVSENRRVLAAVDALKQSDIKLLGKLMYESHYSLKDDYDVSCPELDFLVEQAKQKEYVLGSRMMGGGFGGCTINVIAKERLEEFMGWIADAYFQKFNLELTHYLVSIENGTSVLKL